MWRIPQNGVFTSAVAKSNIFDNQGDGKWRTPSAMYDMYLSLVILAKKQKCYIVVTNNYKDYRFLQGIEVLRPAKIRKIPQ